MRGMIRSMTGFGRAQQVVDGYDITVEVKSVNHRYFEFSARIPRHYGYLEEKIKSYVQSRIARGKVDVYVSVESVEEIAAEVAINHSLAAGYVNALRELAQRYDLRNDISATTVARYSDVFTVRKPVDDVDRIWNVVSGVAANAVDSFILMRENEGNRLRMDIENRAAAILDSVTVVEERSPQTVVLYIEKLEARMKEILNGVSVDEQRLLTEAAIFADKTAVAEETIRLRSHLEELKTMLDSGEAVGRKLDFLIQEINREVNTIGSKANDAPMARIVVGMKAEIEKMREQIQNIE